MDERMDERMGERMDERMEEEDGVAVVVELQASHDARRRRLQGARRARAIETCRRARRRGAGRDSLSPVASHDDAIACCLAR